MVDPNAARPAPAETGREPRVTDRLGGTIDLTNSTLAAQTATSPIYRDRDWWRAEARGRASDWSGVLALHAVVVAAWRARHDIDDGGPAMSACPTCGTEPCVNPTFCRV